MSECGIEFVAGVLQKAANHCILTYPEEACGLFFAPRGSPKVCEFVPCRNIQNDLHQMDPQRYPRTARNAYQIAESEIRKWQEHFSATLELRGIGHSHNDVGVYFSEEDRAMAAPWGEPLFPGVFYLVLGVHHGSSGPTCTSASLYCWTIQKNDFEEKIMDAKEF